MLIWDRGSLQGGGLTTAYLCRSLPKELPVKSGFRRPFRARPIHRRPDNVLQFDASARSGRSQKRPSWWKANWAYAALVAAPVAGVGGAWVWNSFPVEAAMFARESVAEQFEVTLERCSGPERITCVVDGDTFWLEGTKIRIADINTPEVSEPKCAEEAMLGERATDRLVVLLSTGGFSLETVPRQHQWHRFNVVI